MIVNVRAWPIDGPGEAAGGSTRPTTLDFREYLVNDCVTGESLSECGVQAEQQIGYGFFVATKKRNMDLFAHGRQYGTADGRYLADGDLASCAIDKGFDIVEGSIGS